MSQASGKQLEALHELIDHCVRAKEIADVFAPPQLCALIDLLLLEAGKHFVKVMERASEDRSSLTQH